MSKCMLCQLKKPYISNICKHCLEDLPWNRQHCNQCALPLPTTSNQQDTCGPCLSSPPFFSTTRTAFCYQFPINRLIANFKEKQNPPMGKVLGQLLARSLSNDSSIQNNPPELIIPVPSHRHSINQRGYNPAEIIANTLSKQLSIPSESNFIFKRNQSEQQKALSAPERLVNLANAFSITAKGASSIPNYYRIAIVDDVVTTCATANTLSKLLLEAGAQDVIVWAVARTP